MTTRRACRAPSCDGAARAVHFSGGVSNVDTTAPRTLIYKMLFSSISTFETLPVFRRSAKTVYNEPGVLCARTFRWNFPLSRWRWSGVSIYPGNSGVVMHWTLVRMILQPSILPRLQNGLFCVFSEVRSRPEVCAQTCLHEVCYPGTVKYQCTSSYPKI